MNTILIVNTFHIPITKVKTATGFATIEVDMSAVNEDGTPVFSNEVYQYLVEEGLKTVLNSRMSGSKVGAVTKMTGKELVNAHAAAMRIANENLDDLKAGKTKHSRTKAKSTIPAAVRNEAMRLAKAAIKDAVRAAGLTPSHYDEKAYTAKAKELIESDTAYLEQATANIEARKTPQFNLSLDISSLGPTRKPKSPTIPAGAMPKPGVATVHRDARH